MSRRPPGGSGLCLRVAAGLAVWGFAGGAAAVEEELFFSTLPVVATVSRLPQPLSEAPGAVTVIDRELIRASGARSVADLLRLVPGFQVAPTTTDFPRVTYHGLSDDDFSTRVQVLVDGRSLYSPLFQGGVNWNLMPVALEDIERIEVLRGTNSAAFGSNAFLGVVNIITLDPSQAKGATFSASHGNQGVRDATVRFGGSAGPGNFRLTLQQRDDEGITNRNDWIDNFRSRLVDFRGVLNVSERDELQVAAGHVGSALENGRIGKPCDPLRDFEQTSTYLQAGWRRALSDNGELSVRYAHTEDWASDRHAETCSGFLLNVDYGGRAVRDDLEIQHTLAPSRDTRLVWGAASRFDSVHGPIWFYGNQTHHRQVLRGFANLEWRPAAAWLLNFGGMWERDGLTGTTFSPRFSVSFHLSPQDTLRLGATRAYRTPSIFDARGDARASPTFANPGNSLGLPAGPLTPGSIYVRDFLGDPSIKPEKLDSVELGYLADWRDRRMSLDLRLYREHIPNRILSLPELSNCGIFALGACLAGNVDVALNAQDVKVYGAEYQWRWQPFEATRLLLNQALIRIDANLLGVATSADSILRERIRKHAEASAPRHATTLMLMQRLPLGVHFSGTYHFIDKMQWTRNTAQEVAPYRRLDLRLAYPFSLGGKRGEIAYVVQNANGDHAEFKFDRVFTERQWLTLRLDL